MIDRVNRTVLLFLGVLFVTAGAVGVAAHQRVLGLPRPADLYESARGAISARPGVWWALVVAGCVLTAAVGAWCAWRQVVVRQSRPEAIVLKRGDLGDTRLEPAAIARAVAGDLTDGPAITSSRVRVRGFSRQPSLALAVRLDVHDDADVRGVRSYADEAFERLSRTLGIVDVDVDLQVRLRPRVEDVPARVD